MKKGTLLSILGGCLVLASLIGMIALPVRMHLGARHSRSIARQLTQQLPERTQGEPGAHTGMPVLEIGGTDYVAVLEIPAFGLQLPVADRWDPKALHRSPARFCGSTGDGSLVLGGADDPRQLGFCDRIDIGALVTVTDMTGAQFIYRVTRVDRAEQADTAWLTAADCDLTLFCHDVYSMAYVAVRCNLTHNEH